jgi:hypothetical protein
MAVFIYTFFSSFCLEVALLLGEWWAFLSSSPHLTNNNIRDVIAKLYAIIDPILLALTPFNSL